MHGVEYKFTKSREKINHLIYIDDIKVVTKNEKELENLILTIRIYSQDIGMKFDIEKCTMQIMKKGRKQTTN